MSIFGKAKGDHRLWWTGHGRLVSKWFNGTIFAATLLLPCYAAGVIAAQQTVGSLSKPQQEPEAIAILQADLAALGGQSSWADVIGVKVVGEESASDGSKEEFVWEDSWRSKRAHLRRSGTGEKARTYVENEIATVAEPLQSRSSLKRPRARQADLIVALLPALPSVALAMLLTHQEYALSVIQPRIGLFHSQSGERCVQVRKAPTPNQEPVNVTICASEATHRLTTAVIQVRNQISSTIPLSQKITYLDFHADGDRVFAERIQLQNPMGKIETLTFKTITLNPQFTADEFKEHK